ncbi:hypothetical protein EAE96_007809 [Botrytis aclada]|nr:hypothetical protein EAE96_007809 [Botrytis aclada]
MDKNTDKKRIRIYQLETNFQLLEVRHFVKKPHEQETRDKTQVSPIESFFQAWNVE